MSTHSSASRIGMIGGLPSPEPPARSRKRRRWLLRFIALIGLLLSAIWFAPVVVAHTGLRNYFARKALAELRGDVNIGGASLSWFAPIELRDVTVADAQGRTLLTTPKLASSKSLFALATSQSELGDFRVERPVAEVIAEKGSTNLEDALANYMKQDEPTGPTRSAVSVHVTGGKLLLRDTETQKTWEFDALDASVTVPQSRTESIAVKLSSQSIGAKLDADLNLGETGSVKLTTTGFPLEAVAPILRRSQPGLELAGKLTTDVRAEWTTERVRLDGVATVAELDFAVPWLRGDRLRLASAELPLKVEMIGRAVNIERASLKCDVGTLSVAGTLDPDEPIDKVFDRAGVMVEADVNLAKLASLLPHLLRVRDGTTIREGKLTAKLASHSATTGTTWDGEVRTTSLKAVRNGQQIEWSEPLSIEFTGRVPPGQLPTFDRFICKSDFIALNAQGSADSLRAAANVYLGRLSERLAEFVDLNGARFSGNASAWVIASRTPQGAFKLDGAIECGQFEYRDRVGGEWRESGFKLLANTAGHWIKHGPIKLDTGSASFTSGTDSLELKLLDAIPDAKQISIAKLSVHLGGSLDAWMRRVRGFVAVPKHYLFAGKITASGTGRLAPAEFAIDRLLLSIENARFRGAGLDLDEPRINAVADLSLNRATGRTEFARFDIAAPVLTVTNGRLGFEPQQNGELVVSGGGNAVTDLNRLGRTLKIQSDPKGSDALRGRGTGSISFRNQGDATTFGGTLDIKDFAYGDPLKTGISEPAVKLELDGRYDAKPDKLSLTKTRIERSGLAVEATGTFSKFDTTQDVNLTGTITYDWAKLTPELQKSIGGHFHAVGQGTKPFTFVGALYATSPGRSRGDAGIGWTSIRAYGFDMGPGELTAKLAGSVAAFTPVNAMFGGGKISLTPSLRIDPEPAELSFAKGRIVEKAKLTPQVCAGGLGYALPVIANAAQAEGDISVALDESRIPIADPTKATLKGQLIVHKATVGAGPLASEIARLLGAPATTITLANEMTVPVKIENGRVYHENLTLTVNGFVVRSSGSVGFDGSLAMVADVPIPAGLLKNNPQLMKAVAGKTVRVPIAGTMAKPALDPRQFQNAVTNLLRNAAKDFGRDLLNKELDKLFPVMPKK